MDGKLLVAAVIIGSKCRCPFEQYFCLCGRGVRSVISHRCPNGAGGPCEVHSGRARANQFLNDPVQKIRKFTVGVRPVLSRAERHAEGRGDAKGRCPTYRQALDGIGHFSHTRADEHLYTMGQGTLVEDAYYAIVPLDCRRDSHAENIFVGRLKYSE